MVELKYKNPFAMGKLTDLMLARENNDIEFLKEWSRRAVEEHNIAKGIQLKAFEWLIEINKTTKQSVVEIGQMLKEAS